MPSQYTTSDRLEEQGTGENAGTWGNRLNNSTINLTDDSLDGVTSIDCTTGSNIVLTTANGASDEARKRVLQLSGTPSANIKIYIPAVPKNYIVDGTGLLGAKTVTIAVISDVGQGISLGAAERVNIWTDGIDVGEVNRQPEASLAANSVGTSQLQDNAVTAPKVAGGLFVPTATVFDFAGSSAPSGYLLLFGQAISRTTYVDLFNVIGTTYGIGDGVTTFDLPDLRGRATFGKDDMGGGAPAGRITNAVSGITGTTLGAAGGDQNIGIHNHTASVNDPGHTHTANQSGNGVSAGGGDFPIANNRSGGGVPYNNPVSGPVNTTITGVTVIVANGGTGVAANIPPAIIFNKIIKT